MFARSFGQAFRLTSTKLARQFSSNGRYVPPASHLLHPSLAHPLAREWQGECEIRPRDLMYPIFVNDRTNSVEEVKSLPGQHRYSVDRLDEMIEPLVEKGLRSVLIFGVVQSSCKDNTGSFASDFNSPVHKALEHLSKKYPQLFLATDLCLCPYTNHGHCGVLKGNGMEFDNQHSINRLADIGLSYAQAGAHCIAPSDMMDGRIGAIKNELAKHGFGSRVSVMSYSAKFASAYYGPFRDAACSGAQFGDRSGYQLTVPARHLALRAVERDIAEGADMVMVKPGGPYLDIVREVRDRVNVPVALYQVSGEYAMLYHAAQAGAFSLEEAVMESLVCARRAGTDILITYYTPHVLDWLQKKSKK